MPEGPAGGLRRLLAPRSVVVVGGRAAEVAAQQSRAIGYAGHLWAVHPSRSTLGGVACVRSVAELPEPPDAAFVSVPAEQAIAVVGELAARGAGGVVVHASGFAETGQRGEARQAALVAAAGSMALVGPNCLGLVNYLDGAALWPEQQGGRRVERGVAVIAQSGNLAETMTMQRRSLPIAQLVTIGNGAVTGVPELVEGMLADPRVTAIGLCLEAVPEVAELSRVAHEALRRRVPLVVLKLGTSVLGARATLTHTSSLAGSDALADALFRRLGIARVHGLPAFLETLKLLHVHGALPGARVASASCSGGEAAHVADLAERHGVELPALPDAVATRLRGVLGDRVSVGNPLDYHTYVWGDPDALTECYAAVLDAGCDVHLLLLDVPRADRCETDEFDTALAAYGTAQRRAGSRACVVSTLPEGLPEAVAQRLLAAGIAPLQGLDDALAAVSAAAAVGAAQRDPDRRPPRGPDPSAGAGRGSQRWLDEPAAKQALAACGLAVPTGLVGTRDQVVGLADRLGYPVVVKVVSEDRLHKTEAGGVRVGLACATEVRDAVASMASLGSRFLVERMVTGAVLELLVGVRHDPWFGPALTLGAGGVRAELLRDVATVLLPASAGDVEAALRSLRCWPLLAGFRGVGVELGPVLAAVASVVALAGCYDGGPVEVEVNPLLVLPDRVVAVDAVVRPGVPSPVLLGARP